MPLELDAPGLSQDPRKNTLVIVLLCPGLDLSRDGAWLLTRL